MKETWLLEAVFLSCLPACLSHDLQLILPKARSSAAPSQPASLSVPSQRLQLLEKSGCCHHVCGLTAPSLSRSTAQSLAKLNQGKKTPVWACKANKIRPKCLENRKAPQKSGPSDPEVQWSTARARYERCPRGAGWRWWMAQDTHTTWESSLHCWGGGEMKSHRVILIET